MLTTILFPVVLVLDSFMTSIAYGSNGIKVPKKSILIISFIGTLFLLFSLFFASIMKSFLPNLFCTLLSFLLLFLLGIFNFTHFLIHRQTKKEKKFSFGLKQVHIVIDIYFDELKADIDHSSILSAKEAFLLAIALSFDSLLSGFGIGLSTISIPILLLISFLLNIASISFGLFIGKKISKCPYDFSWMSAIIFFILAFLKL